MLLRAFLRFGGCWLRKVLLENQRKNRLIPKIPMGKIIVSPIPSEWFDCGEDEDVDVPFAALKNDHDTISETAVVGLIDQVDIDTENGLCHWEMKESEKAVDYVFDDEGIHDLEEGQKAASLLYDPNTVANSFEEPSISSIESIAASSFDSNCAEASNFAMKVSPTTSAPPYKVIYFRGRESLMKHSVTSKESRDLAESCEDVSPDPGAIRVLGLVEDDINSYFTSTTKSATASPPPSPPTSPLGVTRVSATVERSRHASLPPSSPSHRSTASWPSSSELSGCLGCCKAYLPVMLDYALLVTLSISFILILLLAVLFILHML